MLPIQRILHPTDFSDLAEEALAYALDLAVRTGATLYILHIVDGRDDYHAETHLPASDEEALLIRLRERVNEQLGALSSEARAGLELVYELAEGRHAAPAIVEHAGRRKIDLIVLGTHGRRGLRHLLLGSVAEEVLRRAPCPALIVHSQDDKPAAVRHIMVPVDFSDHASVALKQAKHLAALFEARLTVLYVAEEHLVPFFSDTGIPTFTVMKIDPDIVAKAGEAHQQLDARIEGPDVPTTYAVRRGQPPTEVIECAREEQADFIVIATRGLSGVRRGMIGSVTERVVRIAPCPVWAVHPILEMPNVEAGTAIQEADEDAD